MKRIFSILLITALIIGLMPMMGTVALAEEYATITSTNGYGVRLREGPSKAYNPLGTFDVGTTVQVLQSGSTWSQIVVGGKTGWMLNEFLIFGTTGNGGTSSGSSSAPSGESAKVWSDNGLRVWLRATAGGKRLQLYSAGTPVTVINHGDPWSYVWIEGSYGYMMTYYLNFGEKDAPSEDPVPSVPTSGALKSVSLNYKYPVVLDVMEATIQPTGAKVKYSWKVDGVELGTEPTFSVLTRYAGKTISLTVTGVDGWTGSLTATAQQPVQISKGLKSVELSKQSPVVGDTLSAILQPSSAVVEYSWRVGGAEVSSDATYAVQASDVGKIIQLKVTGIDGYEGSVACSARDAVVSNKDLQSVKLSKVNPKVGETISATVVPAGAAVNYQWSVDGEVVSTGATYAPTRLQLGKQVKLTVTGKDGYVGSVSAITERVVSSTITGVTLSNTAPKTGDTIRANVTPANASVTYQWYADGEALAGRTDVKLYVYDELLGKQLHVEVSGIGVYANETTTDSHTGETTNVVKSAKTEKVTNGFVITGVTLNNTSPVVGTTIKTALIPEAAKDQLHTYVWTIDNEVSTTHDPYYKVKESDVGKVIRVKVTGTGDWSGEVYSSYTKPVAKTTALTGLTILNDSTGENASAVRPETGSILLAQIEPQDAADRDMVEYEWKVDNKVALVGSATMKVYEEYADKRITVNVKAKGDYTGSLTATTQPAVKRTALDVTLNVAKPAEGITPTSSVSVDKVCKGSVEWLMGRLPAELDNYGCFLPYSVYTAKITLTLENGYTMTNANIVVPGATVEEKDGNVVYATFPMTGEQQVTDFHITEVSAPVAGQKAVTSFVTDQYNGIVTWEMNHTDANDIFQSVDTYIAYIGLAPNSGYTFDGLENNIFSVSGASSVSYDSVNRVVTAKYNVSRNLSVIADKSEVLLDGYNSRIVQCEAELSNYIGKFDNVKWEIVEATVDGTSINQDGQLIIGMYETVDRSLTIRATVTLTDDEGKKKEYVGTTSVALRAGTDTDTAIKVEFIQAATTIERGSKGYYEARVSNSIMGSTIFAIWGNNQSLEIGYGTASLNTSIPVLADVSQLVVKAISNEDHSVVASVLVTITEPAPIPTDPGVMPLAEDESSLATLELTGEEAPVVLGEETGIADMDVLDESIPAFSGEEEPAAEPTIEVTLTEEEAVEEPAATEETEEEPAAEPTIEVTLTEEEAVEEPAATEETEEEPAAEPAIEVTLTEEEAVEEPAATEETEEEPAAEPTIEVTLTEEEAVEEPAATEETEEEPAAEPAIEVTLTEEEAVEEPAATEETEEEPAAEPTIEVTLTEEEAVEEPAATEETEEEPAGDEIMTMELVDESIPAYSGEETEETEEEPAAEPTIEVTLTEEDDEEVVEDEASEQQPAAEEEEEELDGVAIAIKDTVTGEVIEEQDTDEAAAAAEEKSSKKSSKKTSKKAESDEAEEIDDPTLDDVENDADVGESTAESGIKIRFTDTVSAIKRGKTAKFAVSVEGSEQGVRWSVRRSADKNGEKVSSISDDGKLTVSKNETAEKLIVVATSVEDGSVRARWIVEVTNAKKTNKTEEAAEDEVVEETDEPEVTDEVEPEAAVEEEVEDIEPETEGPSEEEQRQIDAELDAMKDEYEFVGNFF